MSEKPKIAIIPIINHRQTGIEIKANTVISLINLSHSQLQVAFIYLSVLHITLTSQPLAGTQL